MIRSAPSRRHLQAFPFLPFGSRGRDCFQVWKDGEAFPPPPCVNYNNNNSRRSSGSPGHPSSLLGPSFRTEGDRIEWRQEEEEEAEKQKDKRITNWKEGGKET